MSWTAITTYTPGSPATPPATASDWQNYLTNNLAALMPIGAYMYMHATPTTGSDLVNGCYLECNGQAVDQDTYPDLFALIGTTYGVGDGSTTFNLPDAAGRLLIGAADSGGHADVNALGLSDGNAVANRTARHGHSFAESTHTHTANAGTSGIESNSHAHTFTLPKLDSKVGRGDAGSAAAIVTQTAETSGLGDNSGSGNDHTHSSTLVTNAPSGGVTVTPGGSQPVDAPSFLCAGVLYIKAFQ